MEWLLTDMEKLLKRRARRTHPPPPPEPSPLQQLPERLSRYEVPSRAQERVGLWVSSVGRHVRQPPQNMVRDRVLDCYAAVWISRGQGWYESPVTGRQAVRAGTVMLVLPSVKHGYSAQDGTWDEHWVVFGGRVAVELERQGLIPAQRPLVATGGDARVEALFERLIHIFLKGGPLAIPPASAVTYELLIVLHGLAAGFDAAGRGGDPLVAAALEAIEHDAWKGLTPETLAERLHAGYSTLRRQFKGQTGCGVKEYIQRVQFRRAKELLAAGELNVEEVARACGFEDPLYFSRAFSKRVGQSPTEFRAAQRR